MTLASLPGSALASGQSTRHRQCPKTSWSPSQAGSICGAGEGERRHEAIVVRARGRPDQHPIHRTGQRADSPDMVEIEMGQHQQIDAADAQVPQALGQRLRCRAGIDEHDEPVAACQGRIALPDIAHRELPVCRAVESARRPEPPPHRRAQAPARPRPAEARSGAAPRAPPAGARRAALPARAGWPSAARHRTRRPRRSTPPVATRRARPGLRRVAPRPRAHTPRAPAPSRAAPPARRADSRARRRWAGSDRA